MRRVISIPCIEKHIVVWNWLPLWWYTCWYIHSTPCLHGGTFNNDSNNIQASPSHAHALFRIIWFCLTSMMLYAILTWGAATPSLFANRTTDPHMGSISIGMPFSRSISVDGFVEASGYEETISGVLSWLGKGYTQVNILRIISTRARPAPGLKHSNESGMPIACPTSSVSRALNKSLNK